MKILVTGFDPFGNETTNPAYEAVKRLPDSIADAEIIKLEIPTSFKRSEKEVEAAILKHCPDVVINVGQAGGASCVRIEQTAVNLAQARIPDNDGDQPCGEKLKEDGENAYFSSLPIHAAQKKVQEDKLPCHISYSAGTYVCNSIMYNVQYMIHKKNLNIRAGFVHVPYICEQAVNKPDGTPSMALADITRALTRIIEAVAEDKEDVVSVGSGNIF